MTNKAFKGWKEKGAFKLSHSRLLQVSNNISEDEHAAYTKEEAAEVAKYWGLTCEELVAKVSTENSNLTVALLKAVNKHRQVMSKV